MASYVSVLVAAANSTVVPWTIVSADPSDRFVDLFGSIQAGKFAIVKTSCDLSTAILESVWIGREKSSLSHVDKTLNVSEVCISFGQFVKFVVSVGSSGGSSLTVTKNAFTIMMCSQRRACQPSLPHLLSERTKKDRLFNDIVKMLDQKGLKFSSGQFDSGKSYITTLTSALWYIDQHPSTLASRGCHVL